MEQINEKEDLRAIQLQAVRRRMDDGLGQAERGEVADGEVFMQQLLDDLDAEESTRKAG